ncbi:MAG: GNAT family N-acetyltransferase [Candidatus Omnitrophica bacterium]|nr:GNAT family N-acetyltransferase [Candidatus Omnitrophota bacterium]MDE2223475.1 GNAT family N-acetyltransferase [Candidatus Omnitrophota bacterium]
MCISIGPLTEQDVEQTGKVIRLAFGTFLGLPDPMTFMGDTNYAGTRFKADPASAFIAKMENQIIGSVFVSNWGSVGFFGPLTVHPKFWDKGVAGKLMEEVTNTFERWDTKLAGLFTFPHSTKHLGLYQKFGFWPKYLTSLLAKAVVPPAGERPCRLFSSLSKEQAQEVLRKCFRLTDRLYPGMDVSREIQSVATQKLGDTILIGDDDISGFAVCHAARGSEAVSGVCYVKFAAVMPGQHAAVDFQQLLAAVEHFAFNKGATKITAGCNTGCEEAFRTMLNNGFVREMQGVIMHRPNSEGFYRKDVFVLNDWR